MRLWQQGREALLGTLESLRAEDLERTITIRGEEHDVIDAILRSLGHAAHHMGQIAYLCKLQKEGDWKWITIPPGGSREYNRIMAEKFPR